MGRVGDSAGHSGRDLILARSANYLQRQSTSPPYRPRQQVVDAHDHYRFICRDRSGSVEGEQRELRDDLNQSAKHGHLNGRVVHCWSSARESPRCQGTRVSFAPSCLTCLPKTGDTSAKADLSQGLPEQMSMQGRYGELGPVAIDVGSHGQPGTALVSASAQVDLFRSEVMNVLSETVSRKDRQPNKVLVVSCGLPDDHGYMPGRCLHVPASLGCATGAGSRRAARARAG